MQCLLPAVVKNLTDLSRFNSETTFGSMLVMESSSFRQLCGLFGGTSGALFCSGFTLDDKLDQATITLYSKVMITFAQDRASRLAQFAGRRRRLRISRRSS